MFPSAYFPSGSVSGGGGGGDAGEPTISVEDNEDGTGATATISGSDPASTNTIYTSPWSSGLVAADGSSSGSRTGDGTVSLDVDDGLYDATLVSQVGAAVAVVFTGFRASSGVDPIHYRCCESTVAFLQALSLADVPSANVIMQKLPWNRRDLSPAIFVTPIRETRDSLDNERDEINYGVQISLLRASDSDQTLNLKGELRWRQQITQALSENVPFAGVPEIIDIFVDPGPPVIPSGFAEMFDISTIMLRFQAQMPRGIF